MHTQRMNNVIVFSVLSFLKFEKNIAVVMLLFNSRVPLYACVCLYVSLRAMMVLHSRRGL